MSAAVFPRVRVRPQSPNTPVASTRPDLRDLRLSIRYVPIGSLKRAPRRLRTRERGQLDGIVASLRAYGCVLPLPITGAGELIDGHGVLEALIQLGYEQVPITSIDHLPPEKVRALRIALNKLSEGSVWSPDELGAELDELLRFDPDLIAGTGFSMPEVDGLLAQLNADLGLDPDADAVSTEAMADGASPVISRPADCWLFAGGHKLLCGNARDAASYAALLGSESVEMVASDPPYGCPIKGHVSRSHGEFVEGSGMGEGEAETFFAGFLAPCVAHLVDGAIVQFFIDWRGMYPLQTAMRGAGLVQKALCVWDKGAGGMGSLYRQQAEFVIVAKWGRAPHVNNIELGRYGRNRTTVWQAPGLAQFGRGRKEALGMHPTVKPVGLIADMLLDTSRIGGVILDPFCGSGTTLLAAHRTRRLGRGIELDPRFVDVAVRRMEASTGEPARLAGTDLTFAEVAAARLAEEAAEDRPYPRIGAGEPA